MGEEKQIVILSVKSIYDNPLLETGVPSRFEQDIQAGAALTDQRIAEWNDYDGTEDSISGENRRFSELTALYWAWKHCKQEYIGLCHYRRKFDLTDEMLEQACQKGVDLIILEEEPLEKTIEALYSDFHYTYDWHYTMELIREREPLFYEFLVKKEHRSIHPACMAIYHRSYLEEVCNFLFPILFTFCQNRPEKRDVYQRRDAGFLGERLLSLYFEYRKDSLTYLEVPLRTISSRHFLDVTGEQKDMDVMAEINGLLEKNNWTKCCKLILTQENPDENMVILQKLARLFIFERKQEKETFYDYDTPLENVEDLLSFYREMAGGIMELWKKGATEASLGQFLRDNRISQSAVLKIMEMELRS